MRGRALLRGRVNFTGIPRMIKNVWSVERKRMIRHFVFGWDCTHPNSYEGNFLFCKAVGLEGNMEKVNYEAVEVTKRRFGWWW